MRRTFQPLVLSILIFGILITSANAQSDHPVVSWSDSEITQVIGGAQTISPVVVRFRVLRPLTNVSLFVVPEIRRFVTVQSSDFSNLQPSTEYSIPLLFSVPTRAAEGFYSGTIHLRQGG